MSSILGLLYWALNIFLFALIARLILDYVRMFSPNWRPKGVVLAAAELVYSVTDRPLAFTRQFVPPLRLGRITLYLSFIVVFFIVPFLITLVVAL